MKLGRKKPAILKYKIYLAQIIRKHPKFKDVSVNKGLNRFYWTGEIILDSNKYRIHWQNYIRKLAVDYVSISGENGELTKTQLIKLEQLLLLK